MIRLKMFQAFFVQVLVVMLTLPAVAQTAPDVAVTEKIHGFERLSGAVFAFGQTSLAGDGCARAHAFVEKRGADGRVVWRRAALFDAPGDLEADFVVSSTVREALATADGEVYATGDVLLGWSDARGEAVTARGAFVVVLTADGTPYAERYFGALPDGPPRMVTTCLDVCGGLLKARLPAASGRAVALGEDGSLVAGGWRRARGLTTPFVAALTRDLAVVRRMSSPAGAPELAAALRAAPSPAPTDLLIGVPVVKEPVDETDPMSGQSGHVNAPTNFEVRTGLLLSGNTASLGQSDDDYLTVLAAVQSSRSDRIEVRATIDIDAHAPILDDVHVEITGDECSTVSMSVSGGYGGEVHDLGDMSVCPFEEPVLVFAVPAAAAQEMGFTATGGAAGNAPLVVDVTIDLLRASSALRAKGGSSASVDQITSTTSYP